MTAKEPDSMPDAARRGEGRDMESLRAELAASAPAVRRYLFGLCGDWHEAEDCAQEALLKAWARRAQFDGRAAPRTWIFAIARNQWLDRLRRKQVRRKQETMPEELDRLASPQSPPHAAAGRNELREAIRRAVAHLPPEQGEALALRESEGLTFAQVAEVLGVPTGTAKSRVRYALLKLAEELAPFRRELEP